MIIRRIQKTDNQFGKDEMINEIKKEERLT